MYWIVVLVFVSSLFAADCPVELLEPGATVEGILGDSACKAQDILPSASTVEIPGIRQLASNAYTLTVEEGGGILKLQLTSASFPPLVVLVNEKREVMQYVEGLTTSPAVLTMSVKAGKYTVLAVTRNTTVGAYTLQAELQQRRPCEAPDLKYGEVLNGELTAGDCRGLDLLTPSTNLRPIDTYHIAVDSNTLVGVAAASNAFLPVLAMVNAKTREVVNNGENSNNGTQAQLVLSLPEGEFDLVVTSGGTSAGGTYLLRALREAARTCPVETLAAPGSVRGALTNNDCRLLDFIPFSSNFSFIRAYTVEVAERSLVTFDLTSTQFDSYLNVLRENKTFIAEDDDSGGNGNSRISVTLREGKYTVLANSYSEGEIGAFDLRASVAAPRECPTAELPLTGTVNAELTANDCRIRDLLVEEPSGSPARQFQLTLEEAATVRLEMLSSASAAGMVLTGEKGAQRNLGLEQLSNGALRGEVSLEAGSYTVIAYSGNLRLGAFTISASVLP